MSGKLFGRYEALTPLGRGGMGQVWRGRDPLLDRAVAIKELSPARELPDKLREEYRERFFREARAAARLIHPNIVQVFDVGVSAEGAPYLVMELVEGASLDAALRAGTAFPPDEAARIGEALARALAVAHRAGIVHRDVKPANALRAADGTVKLTDFGIARLADSTLTRDGNFLGSPQFSAPEQVRGMVPDARADLYSLGLLVYLLLTRRHPFARPTLPETMRAIVHEPVPPPSTLREGLDPRWDGFLARALAKDPAERFPDAEAMAEAFASIGRPAGSAAAPAEAGGETRGEALVLVVTDGPARGRRIALDRPLEVGRESGDLPLGDPTVSGRHARIERDGAAWVVRDCGSTNGTWVDGERTERVELRPGVVIGFGQNTRVRIEAAGDVPAAGPAGPRPASTVLDAGPKGKTAAFRPLAGAPRFVLVVKQGPAAGKRIAVDRPIVLGRDDGDLPLGDDRVSRKHALVEPRGASRVFARDLASSNGTWLGGERIREVELKPGDELTLGSSVVVLVAER